MTALAHRVADGVARLARRASSEGRTGRRILGGGATSLGGLAVLVVTVLVASGVPVVGWLDGLAVRHAVDLQLGEGRLAPFRVEGIRALLGPGVADALLGPESGSGGATPGSRSAPSAAPAPGSGAPVDPPQRGALSPLLSPGSWVLTVEMAADRATVAPSEEIVYAITVRNVGAEAFPSGTNFELQWHIPFGTVNSTPLQCTPPGFPIDLEAFCPPVAIPFPGTPTSSHGSTNSLGLISIPPGGSFVREVRVTVGTSTEPDQTLRNHAHLDVTGDGAQAITSNEVVVVVVAPSPPGVPQ